MINKVLNISCNLLNTVKKLKNRMTAWIQNYFKCTGWSPLWLHGWLGHGAICCCPALTEYRTPPLGWEKAKIHSKYSFYWGAWLASLEHVTPDLRVMSPSPTWDVEITYIKQQQQQKYESYWMHFNFTPL